MRITAEDIKSKWSKTTRGKCELSSNSNNSTQGTYNTLTKTEGQVNEDQVKLITHCGGEKNRGRKREVG